VRERRQEAKLKRDVVADKAATAAAERELPEMRALYEASTVPSLLSPPSRPPPPSLSLLVFHSLCDGSRESTVASRPPSFSPPSSCVRPVKSEQHPTLLVVPCPLA
jgi:hypothetical protein